MRENCSCEPDHTMSASGVRTVTIFGFPRDATERELENMVRFSNGKSWKAMENHARLVFL